MIDPNIMMITERIGFPALIVLILLYDKMKTNGRILKVVENNSIIMTEIKNKLC